MQKRFILFVFILLFCVYSGFAPTASASSSASNVVVSSEDWTITAIENLSSTRQIPGFDIPNKINRTQGALLVSRLLQHLTGEDEGDSRRFGVSKNVYLDNMIFTYNQRVTPEEALTTNQVEALYLLVLEFRDELEILGYSIQDFNMLAEMSPRRGQQGLFSQRPLLYSEQALSAARKLDDESKLNDFILQTKQNNPQQLEQSVVEIMQPPIEPKNLWTGHFTSEGRYLPPSNRLIAQEPTLDSPQNPIQLGAIEVSGALRALTTDNEPRDKQDDSQSGAGYGILVKMGDLALNTALDVAVDPTLEPKIASTSVGLSLDWADLFTLSAGIKQQDLLKAAADAEPVLPLVTSLGVVVPITRGRVHLGMSQEWPKSSGEEGEEPPDDESNQSVFLPKNTAEVGLRYDFKNDSSLRLNYMLIDFSDVEQDHYKAKAEFSIKF